MFLLPFQFNLPFKVILQKLSDLAQSWSDFYIGNVLNREGRAAKFKETIVKRLSKVDQHYVLCKRGHTNDDDSRKRRSYALEAMDFSDGMFDEETGRQVKKLSNDPVRSNDQIFVNLKNWIWRNMNGCPTAERHFKKLTDLQKKWTHVFNTVLKKIDAKRAHW